ncbi:MAG: chalcone isomerase family protein [Thermodesulfobacteriota bacterium]
MRPKSMMMVIWLICLTETAWSAEVAGVSLPDSLAVDGINLVLNGAGLRKKLVIKVYAAGLYLTQKDRNSQAIVDADKPMAIRMHFIYDGVTAKQLIETWNEGFAVTMGENAPALKDRVASFNSFFTREAKKNDRYDLIYQPQKGTSLVINDNPAGTISGLDFKKALFSIWLGEKASNKGLKAALLGE